MAKRALTPELAQLESAMIATMIAGLKEFRPDLTYPESHSDMSAAVRGLLRMFRIERLPLPRELEYAPPWVPESTLPTAGESK